jgi:hypothetical protein
MRGFFIFHLKTISFFTYITWLLFDRRGLGGSAIRNLWEACFEWIAHYDQVVSNFQEVEGNGGVFFGLEQNGAHAYLD